METLQEYQAGVFSAHAEVVPASWGSDGFLGRILRARGGSSGWVKFLNIYLRYSPRTRR